MVKQLENPINYFVAELEFKGITGFVSSYIIPYNNQDCFIVDTGPQNSYTLLAESIRKVGCYPKQVLLTHIHLDHGGGAGSLIKEFEYTTVYVHPRGRKHIINPSRLWEASVQALGEVAYLYGNPQPANEKNVVATHDGQIINLGDIEINILFTPGHASHHQSFHLREHKILFTGDSAGMYFREHNITMPTTPRPFFYQDYMESLKKQEKLNPQYIALPHNTVLENNGYIESHMEQVDTWIGVLEKFVEKKAEIKDIYGEAIEKLAEVDENVRKAKGLVKGIYRHLLIMSIDGILDYLNRKLLE